MATSTTNLGLTKPAGTDKIRIAQINGNMDILDDKIGAVGNTSLQAQITSQNEAIAKLTGKGSLDVISDLSSIISTMTDGSIQWNKYTNTASNKPDNHGGTVRSYRYSANYGSQLVVSDGGVFYRILSGGTYGDWEQLALNSKIITQDVTVTVSVSSTSRDYVTSTFNCPSGYTPVCWTLINANIGSAFHIQASTFESDGSFSMVYDSAGAKSNYGITFKVLFMKI